MNKDSIVDASILSKLYETKEVFNGVGIKIYAEMADFTSKFKTKEFNLTKDGFKKWATQFLCGINNKMIDSVSDAHIFRENSKCMTNHILRKFDSIRFFNCRSQTSQSTDE